ncbi:hypothetical protein PHYSODRAFT_294341 [Phytophthora sojae]|uniref:Armadillo repeat-containing domain-containing protein n=1 Tax=Phytophthora sojae (strain P6497) TaxID=1094619 RepID=G4YDX9_PHYSP|nr:hypothetical protein PHYSODRAFT_294341 [Phytophthora sojae]EGZ28997.1 hypothetical protein PHYSODRAFT_294341 [Phytophthora sojae]|eukprot:XP_009516272.1 hypothetical protein PHYSODRAFT_294341 [Phytophthora sojae]
MEQSCWALSRLSKSSKLDVIIAAIPSLVSSESRSRRLYSDWELGNVVFDNDANRDAIVDAGAIPDPIKLLRSGASELQGHIILLVANLTVSRVHQSQITGEIGLSLFAARLQDGSEAAKTHSARMLAYSTQKMHAAQALGNLTLDRRARNFIVDQGVVVSAKQWAAYLLDNASWYQAHHNAIASAGVLDPVVALLRAGNNRQKEHAICILENLLENGERRQAVLDAGAIAPEQNEMVTDGAVRVRSSLSSTRTARSAIAAAGAIPPLVELLQSRSNETRAEAAFVLGQVAAESPEYKTVIINRGAGA